MARILGLWRALIVLPPALALMTPGCGGSSSGGLGDGNDAGQNGSATPLADVPALLAKALCGVEEQCLGPLLPIYLKDQDCVDKSTKAIEEGSFSLFEGGITAGTVHYDGTKVADCTNAIQAAGCAALSTRLSSLCGGVLQGSVAAGAACTFDAECATGLFCKTDQACPGTCAPLLSAGQDCVIADDCQDGLSCAGATNKCAKPAGSGEPCNGGSAPPCNPSLVCQGASATTPGTCVAPSAAFTAAAGVTCDPTSAQFCQTNLSCAFVSLSANGRYQCEAAPAAGAACHVAYPEECPSGQFCVLAANSLTGACKPLPTDGQPCGKHSPSDPNSTDKLCAVETNCDQGTCRALQHLGGTCTTGDDCYSTVCNNGGCAPTKCASN